MNRVLFVAALALTVSIAVGAEGSATPYDVKQAPWPCWRGPYFNGSAPDQGIELIDDLGKAKLLWKSDVPIPAAHPGSGGVRGYWCGGYSSPIVAQGRVYIAYWTPPGRTNYVHTEEDKKPEYRITRRNPAKRDDLTADDVLHCFDAKTGKTVFRTVLAGKGLMRPSSKSGCHMTPCWWDGKVYFSGSGERHYCVDATTGELRWSAEAPFTRHGGKWASPVAIDGVVAIGSGGKIVGYDATNGTALWRAGNGNKVSVVTPWSYEGKAYFINKGKLIEAKTGKVLWDASDSLPEGGTLPEYSTWPAAGTHTVLIRMISPAEGTKQVTQTWPVCFEISPINCRAAWTGEAHVTRSIGIASFAAPIVYQNRVYVVSGSTFRCYDLASGALLGSMPGGRRTDVRGIGYTNVGVEGRLLLATGRSVKMLSADPKDLRLLGSETPQARANSTGIAYADGLLYFRTESSTDARLVCYDLRATAKRSEDGRTQ